MKPQAPVDPNEYVLRSMWERSKQLAHMFWKRWVQDYLPVLSGRQKWRAKVEPLAVGDIVLEGRAVEVHEADHGQVRSVQVQTSYGVYQRPDVKVAKLDLEPPRILE